MNSVTASQPQVDLLSVLIFIPCLSVAISILIALTSVFVSSMYTFIIMICNLILIMTDVSPGLCIFIALSQSLFTDLKFSCCKSIMTLWMISLAFRTFLKAKSTL
jgi:hypothetical protein